MHTVQFQGESNWESIVNYNSLNIEEEEDFEVFVKQQGGNRSTPLTELERLYQLFCEQ